MPLSPAHPHGEQRHDRAGVGEPYPCPAPCLSFPFHCYPDCSLLGTRTRPETQQEKRGGLLPDGKHQPILDPWPLSQNEGPVEAAAETAQKMPLLPNTLKLRCWRGCGTGWAPGCSSRAAPKSFVLPTSQEPPPGPALPPALRSRYQLLPLEETCGAMLCSRGSVTRTNLPEAAPWGPAAPSIACCRAGGHPMPPAPASRGEKHRETSRHPHAGSSLVSLSARAEGETRY